MFKLPPSTNIALTKVEAKGWSYKLPGLDTEQLEVLGLTAEEIVTVVDVPQALSKILEYDVVSKTIKVKEKLEIPPGSYKVKITLTT